MVSALQAESMMAAKVRLLRLSKNMTGLLKASLDGGTVQIVRHCFLSIKRTNVPCLMVMYHMYQM
ncbi:MAG: hypothetical protein H0X50_12335 [Nitrosopumilus sp.]|nr:hypothetical protein [Nitrosopumilus sp.]